MDIHSQSFFGQKTGIILNSAKNNEPNIFLRFIKKKEDGSWEKPSLKEGKNIKFNLLEIIEILRIFSSENSKWTTVHKFGNDSTSISFENSDNTVKIYISGYSKYMKFPEIKLFYDLLTHIYHEKIEFSTGFTNNYQNYANNAITYQKNITVSTLKSEKEPERKPERKPEKELEREKKMEWNQEIDENLSHNPDEWFKALKVKDEFRLVPGEIINRSEKALRFQVLGKSEIWIPNSCASIDMNPHLQGIWIKEWFLKRKLDDIFPKVAG